MSDPPFLMKNRYIVGIDLGTTNSAVGYVDLHDAAPGAIRILTFGIPQLVSQGWLADRPALPSFLYLPAEHELAAGALSLPWDRERRYAVGVYARDQGPNCPGRLVSSAKSWLCHGGVDRDAPILPWEAGDDVAKVSPVTASARYLQHMREAWDHVMPAPLAEQKVVLTVPASFDEVAREFTVRAAREAGLSEVVLLDEPLAAFYAWLSGHEQDWQGHLAPGEVLLVCDVGGGTTDFSLIACDEADGSPRLERIAVGDHLLLGGDNMDLALAHMAERSIGRELDARRWRSMVHQCRKAKEDLLGEDAPREAVVRIAGLGRSVVGGTLVGRISRDEALSAILEGFFPGGGAASASPASGSLPAQRESGLPYEQDTAVTRHLFRFISRHGTDRMPGAVLFNGGALLPRVLRDRILDAVSTWSGRQVRELESVSLDLAVSVGAAYSGLVREGLGLRVGGGSARSYYIGLGTEEGAAGRTAQAVCLVERGTEEGEDVEIVQPFQVRANRPVRFSLYSSTTRKGDRSGEVVDVDKDFVALPPVQTVLRYGKKDLDRTIPVRVGAQVTPIGTLEFYCESRESPHRWRLQFQLRGTGKEGPAPASGVEGVRVAPIAAQEKGAEGLSERDRLALEEAVKAVRLCFGRTEAGDTISPGELAGRIASVMGMEKELWSVPVIRAIADVCLEVRAGRALSREHEERWFNLAGFCLRPGTGEAMDPWRIKKVWPLFFEGLFFPREVSVRLQWWIFWRRITAGLGSGQQAQFYGTIAPVLVPAAASRGRKRAKARPPRVTPEERRQMFLFAAGLERLDVPAKIDLGRAIIAELGRDHTWPGWLWSLSRIAAREPLYGPANKTVPPGEAGEWLKALMGMRLLAGRGTAEACLAMARLTGDRTRDLAPAVRNDLFRWLSNRGSRISDLTPLVQVVPVERDERESAFGEALPEGLLILREGSA